MLVKLKYLKVVKNINNDVYEWESLRQSIKTEGYDVKKYGMIHVKKFCNNNYLIILPIFVVMSVVIIICTIIYFLSFY